ncbi:hypothetical protein ACVIHH_003718 [Bradyrhizobium sp. USDA 4518]
MARRVKVNDGGVVKTLSPGEAIIARNYQAALKQDQTAMGNMPKLIEYVGQFLDWNDPKVASLPIFMPESAKSVEELLAYTGARLVKVSGEQTGDQ